VMRTTQEVPVALAEAPQRGRSKASEASQRSPWIGPQAVGRTLPLSVHLPPSSPEFDRQLTV